MLPSNDSFLLTLIFVVASLLHGISGLGITLVTTTALASIFPLQQAIILTILPSLTLSDVLASGGHSFLLQLIHYRELYDHHYRQ